MGILDQIANPKQVNIGNYYQGLQQRQARAAEVQRQQAVNLQMESAVLGNERARTLLDHLLEDRPETLRKRSVQKKLDKAALENVEIKTNLERQERVFMALRDSAGQQDYDQRLAALKQQFAPGLTPKEFERDWLKPNGIGPEYNKESIAALSSKVLNTVGEQQERIRDLREHQQALQMEAAKARTKAAGVSGNPKYQRTETQFVSDMNKAAANRDQLAYGIAEEGLMKFRQRVALEEREGDEKEMKTTLVDIFPGVRKIESPNFDPDTSDIDWDSYNSMKLNYRTLLKDPKSDTFRDHKKTAQRIERNWKEVHVEGFEIIGQGSLNPFKPDTIKYIPTTLEEQIAFDNKHNLNVGFQLASTTNENILSLEQYLVYEEEQERAEQLRTQTALNLSSGQQTPNP